MLESYSTNRNIPGSPKVQIKHINKQRLIFLFIRDYKKENGGNSPTIRQICEATGIKSVSHMTEELALLESSGYISRSRYANRSIVITSTTAPEADNALRRVKSR